MVCFAKPKSHTKWLSISKHHISPYFIFSFSQCGTSTVLLLCGFYDYDYYYYECYNYHVLTLHIETFSLCFSLDPFNWASFNLVIMIIIVIVCYCECDHTFTICAYVSLIPPSLPPHCHSCLVCSSSDMWWPYIYVRLSHDFIDTHFTVSVCVCVVSGMFKKHNKFSHCQPVGNALQSLLCMMLTACAGISCLLKVFVFAAVFILWLLCTGWTVCLQLV